MLPIVIDNGTASIKAGFGGDGMPSIDIPTISTAMKSPIERGIVKDWDAMETIWEHLLTNDLKIDASNHQIFVAEKCPKENCEKMTEIMFEKFNVSQFYVAFSGVMSLYASGRSTGIVVDSGEGVTQVTPIYEGYSVPHAYQMSKFGGSDLTDYLTKLLFERGYSVYSLSNREKIQEVKEKCCFVSCNNENVDEIIYKTLDGSSLKIGNERFQCTEALFQPSLMGINATGIPGMINKSIMESDIDIRKDLYMNVILSGGTAMFSGISERLTKELLNYKRYFVPKVKVFGIPDQKYAVWIGGSILSSMPSFETMWITQADYAENGPKISKSKCQI